MYLTRTSSHPAAASGSRPRFRRRRLGDGSGWRCGVSVPAEGSLCETCLVTWRRATVLSTMCRCTGNPSPTVMR